MPAKAPAVWPWLQPRCRFIFLLCTLAMSMNKIASSQPHDHVVGGSIWSIPVNDDFYAAWSTNTSFSVGDNLVFRFETGLSDAVQVSRREFESCSAENAFRSFEIGPAVVPLAEQGMHYFVCSHGNYCFLGQKVSVQVQRFSLFGAEEVPSLSSGDVVSSADFITAW